MNQSPRVSPLSFISCLVICFGISTLLVSTTSAQIASPGPVNGLGPSPASTFAAVFNLPTDVFVGGGAGTTQINVNGGGPFSFALGLGEELNVNGGTIGNGLSAGFGSEVNVIAGSVGNDFEAFGSVVSISGGTVGDDFVSTTDTEVNISGGTIGSGFGAFDSSVVNISGGVFGGNFAANSGTTINLLGSQFFLDNVALGSALDQVIPDRDVTLSGVLAGGESFSFDLNSAFVFGEDFFSPSSTVTVTTSVPEPSSAALITLALAMGFIRRRRRVANCDPTAEKQINRPVFANSIMALRSILIFFMSLALTSALNAQSTIDLLPGDSISDNTVIASGSTVNVQGGTIGLGVDLSDGFLNIDSGSVAAGATGIGTGFTNSNNQVNLSGGMVGGFFQLTNDTDLSITGGSIESFGVFGAGATADISGGTVSRFPDIFAGGVVNISGGDVFSVRVFDGGEVNFFGSQFFLDGNPIALTAGQQQIIDQRNVTLSGILADGSFIETDLNTVFGGFFSDNPDGAGVEAIVTVTSVVPEPSTSAVFFAAAAFMFARRNRS